MMEASIKIKDGRARHRMDMGVHRVIRSWPLLVCVYGSFQKSGVLFRTLGVRVIRSEYVGVYL